MSPTVTLLVGDVREQLRTVPDASVHCVVTSPPYWGLRDYDLPPLVWGDDPACEHEWGEVVGANRSPRSDDVETVGCSDGGVGRGPRPATPISAFCCRCPAWRGSLGLEPTPELYVEHLVAVFREVRRVLRDDGTLWLNMGDTYAAGHGGSTTEGNYIPKVTRHRDAKPRARDDLANSPAGWAERDVTPKRITAGLKPKDLIGIPWRVAFALQADGWYLRSDVIWAKPNPMPESVTDRPTRSHEYVFLLSKSARYYFDNEAVKERSVGTNHHDLTGGQYAPPGQIPHTGSRKPSKSEMIGENGRNVQSVGSEAERRDEIGAFNNNPRMRPNTGRNLRSVWHIATQPYPEAHFATFPEALVRPCILAGTSERGVCQTCGVPWERITEPTGHINKREPAHQPANTPTKVDSTGWAQTSRYSGFWRPTCDHGGEPVPATVLDPFAGSGTTLLVAQSLGRSAVGIELNPEYAALAEHRTAQSVLV